MNLVEKHKNSKLFIKPRYFIKPHILWEWDDFGIMFRVYRNTDVMDYSISIDIQIAWFNLWIQCFKRTS